MLRTTDTDDGLEVYWEGLSLIAYPDPVSGGDPWTIGYGHTGPEVEKGLVITQAQADAWLQEDRQKARDIIAKLVHVHLNEHEILALEDFIVNLGGTNFAGSTLLKYINTGNFEAAAGEFEKWDHACGKVVVGLLRRRQAEKAEWEKGMEEGS